MLTYDAIYGSANDGDDGMREVSSRVECAPSAYWFYHWFFPSSSMDPGNFPLLHEHTVDVRWGNNLSIN